MMDIAFRLRCPNPGSGPLNTLSFIEDMNAVVKNLHVSAEGGKRPGLWSSMCKELTMHFKRWNGHNEATDPVSGRHHLVHIAACAAVLWSFEQAGHGVDDRTGTKAHEIMENLDLQLSTFTSKD